MVVRRGWQNGQWIEVAQHNSSAVLLPHQADFVFDMTNFRVLKNRFGSCDLTPQQACDTLSECVEHGDTRILLLVG